MNIIDEWFNSESAKRDALKFKSACDSMDSLRYYTLLIRGRNCGKTELAILQDKVYNTLGIKEYLNKVYGDPMFKFKNGNYIGYDIDLTNNDKLKELFKTPDIVDLVNQIKKEEEKNKMADQKQEHIFIIKNTRGDRYEVTIEKDFRRRDYLYHVNVCYLKNTGEKRFASSFYYHYWEQVETQLMYDLKNIGCTVHEDCRDYVTCELKRAKSIFSGDSYANYDSPYQGGYVYSGSKAKSPFEAMPKIEKVIFNPPATIVKWKDGTKTVVKCQDDDEFDWEKGLAMAYVKRAFNNERTYYGLFKKNEPFMNLPNSNMKYDPNEVKKLELFVPKDVVITEKGMHDAVDALVKACDDKIDEMLGDVDISKEMEFIETGKWPEKGDKKHE